MANGGLEVRGVGLGESRDVETEIVGIVLESLIPL
jgi:hypothetical protein